MTNKKSMQDLAHIVTVRNHLYSLLTSGDKNRIAKQDVKSVNDLIISLDRDFVRSALELSVQDKIDNIIDLDVEKRVAEVKAQLEAELGQEATKVIKTTKKGSFKRATEE